MARWLYSDNEEDGFRGNFRSRDAALAAGRKAIAADRDAPDPTICARWPIWTARRATKAEAQDFPDPGEDNFKFWVVDTIKHE